MKRVNHLSYVGLCIILLLSGQYRSLAVDRAVEYQAGKHVASGFTLQDFYSENPQLDRIVNDIMITLTNRERIAQLVVTSVGERGRTPGQVEGLLGYTNLGGVLFLGGPKQEIRRLTRSFTAIAKGRYNLLPFFIIDGEPSLIGQRVIGTKPLPPAAQIKDEQECREVAGEISLILNDLNIHINYAPVCDFSVNREVIGSRSFGDDEQRIWEMAHAFIETMQDNGIVATVKHFPGHGSVRGDTHHSTIVIDEVPPELSVFKKSIEAGVLSVMVGHIGVAGDSDQFGEIDTYGKPATISRNLVTGLLKESMQFRGIVVTDAMNMESVVHYEKPSLQAVRAGCDMVLMPEDEIEFTESLLEEMSRDIELYRQVSESVRKVVRLKVCLGLVHEDFY
jgi:beta-N-acetylhexosaminidase